MARARGHKHASSQPQCKRRRRHETNNDRRHEVKSTFSYFKAAAHPKTEEDTCKVDSLMVRNTGSCYPPKFPMGKDLSERQTDVFKWGS
mmetsp:Transcript_86884/g.173805  ORF Transcript_86884/g.173805 Transcript_86884/m.173805 type:complete len:89 (+) Transcript_86884:331-597(+)